MSCTSPRWLHRDIGLCCAVALGAAGALAQNPPPDVQAKIIPLFQSARQAEQRQDFDAASKFYDQILALDPKIAEVWTNKGLVLHQLDRHGEALSAFARAVALKPSLVTPQLFLGIEYLKANKPELAVAPLEKVLMLEPGQKQAAYELADAYIRLERFEPAVRLCRNLIENNPVMEQAWYRLGIAYLNWSKATSRQLIDSQPRSGWGSLLLADFEAVVGFTEDAEASYRAAIDMLPDAVEPRVALGRFYLEVDPVPEKLPRAREQYAGAGELAHEPQRTQIARICDSLARGDVAQARTIAAEIKFEQEPAIDGALNAGRQAANDARSLYRLSLALRELARATFEQTVSRNPDSYRAHLLLAELASDSRDQAAARAEYRKAAELAPADPEVQLLYMQWLVASGDASGALSVTREAVVKFPTHPGLAIELGKLLLKSGDVKAAALQFERSLKADPTLTEARAGLADCYAAAGEMEKGIAEMRRALPGDADGSLHYRLGRWYQKLGREGDAQQAFAETARLKQEKRKSELMRFTLTRQAPPGGDR